MYDYDDCDDSCDDYDDYYVYDDHDDYEDARKPCEHLVQTFDVSADSVAIGEMLIAKFEEN